MNVTSASTVATTAHTALENVGRQRYAIYTGVFASLSALAFGLSLNRCLRYAALRGTHCRSFQRTCLGCFLAISVLLTFTSFDHLGYYGILPYGLVNVLLCVCYGLVFAVGILFVVQLLYMLSIAGLVSLSLGTIRKLGGVLVGVESFAWVFCGLMETLEVGGTANQTYWLAAQELFSAAVLLLLTGIQAWSVRAAKVFLVRSGSTRSRHIRSLLCYTYTTAVVALACLAGQLRQGYIHITVGDTLMDDPAAGMTPEAANLFLLKQTWGVILLWSGLLTGIRLVWSVRGASFGLNSLRNSVDSDVSGTDYADVSPPASVRLRIEEFGPGALREAQGKGGAPQHLSKIFFGDDDRFASHPLFDMAAATTFADSLLAYDALEGGEQRSPLPPRSSRFSRSAQG